MSDTIKVIGAITCVAMVCIAAAAIMRPESAAIITGISAIATFVVMGLMQIATAERAASRAAYVADTLEKSTAEQAATSARQELKINEVVQTSKTTLAHVNAERGEMLAALAHSLRVIATLTPSSTNEGKAAAAEQRSAAHAAQQKKMDAADMRGMAAERASAKEASEHVTEMSDKVDTAIDKVEVVIDKVEKKL